MANTNLTTLFTNIADALREKGGTEDKIKASDFAQAIADLPSGGGITNVEVDEIEFTDDCSTADGVDIVIPFDTCPVITVVCEKEMSIGVASTTTRDLIELSLPIINGSIAGQQYAVVYNNREHTTFANRGQNFAYDGETNTITVSATSNCIFKSGIEYRIIGIWL